MTAPNRRHVQISVTYCEIVEPLDGWAVWPWAPSPPVQRHLPVSYANEAVNCELRGGGGAEPLNAETLIEGKQRRIDAGG